jgi:hypothetical protein
MLDSSLNTYCAAMNQLVAVNGFILQYGTSKSLLEGKPFMHNPIYELGVRLAGRL